MLQGYDHLRGPVMCSANSGCHDYRAHHLTLPVSHTFLMNNPMVIAQVLAFLREGRFEADLTLPAAIMRLVTSLKR